jgi:hypothetical protein
LANLEKRVGDRETWRRGDAEIGGLQKHGKTEKREHTKTKGEYPPLPRIRGISVGNGFSDADIRSEQILLSGREILAHGPNTTVFPLSLYKYR